MSDIISYLFETKAIKFCEENKPFWYTSGKIGPYFINTHFVFGGEEDANNFLSYIDDCLTDKITLPQKVYKKVLSQYNNNEIFHNVIETMKNYIQENIDLTAVDYISGGERRDWFFSNILAHLLNKPHITIFKDLSTLVSDSNFENTTYVPKILNKNVLHIADLITVASSYIRAWIPAIRSMGGNMAYSCVVVDRMQGGRERIENEGVKSFSLVQVDNTLFETALDKGIINKAQLELLEGFFKDPDGTMKNFLLNHPDFLENALHSDEKTIKRAKLLIDGNLYNLNNN